MVSSVRRPAMKRSWLMSLLAILILVPAASGQLTEAEIHFFHRAKKKEDTVKGTILEETPGQIAYRISGRTEKVPATDVIDVVYQAPSALVRQEYRRAQRDEDEIEKAADAEARKKAIQDAIAGYQAVQPKLSDSIYASRHAAWKIARLTARLAEEDDSRRDAAIGALSKFLKEHGSGWQVAGAAKLLAGLQLEKGDLAGAQKTFQELAAKPDLAKETRQDYELLVVRAMLRGGQHAAARIELDRMKARLLPDDTSMMVRVSIYLAGCQGAAGQVEEAKKQLLPIVEGDADPRIKALACNTLADCYLKDGKAEEAFWRYLMVDALYNQDPEEHARALYHLSRLFDKVKKNPARAQECRERLLKEKQFAGVEYRAVALKEK